jgi:hypothetical protein
MAGMSIERMCKIADGCEATGWFGAAAAIRGRAKGKEFEKLEQKWAIRKSIARHKRHLVEKERTHADAGR